MSALSPDAVGGIDTLSTRSLQATGYCVCSSIIRQFAVSRWHTPEHLNAPGLLPVSKRSQGDGYVSINIRLSSSSSWVWVTMISSSPGRISV